MCNVTLAFLSVVSRRLQTAPRKAQGRGDPRHGEGGAKQLITFSSVASTAWLVVISQGRKGWTILQTAQSQVPGAYLLGSRGGPDIGQLHSKPSASHPSRV